MPNSVLLDDIHHLTSLLEAEHEGRPFDRAKMRQLADSLGQISPSIRRSMGLIAQRAGSDATKH